MYTLLSKEKQLRALFLKKGAPFSILKTLSVKLEVNHLDHYFNSSKAAV